MEAFSICAMAYFDHLNNLAKPAYNLAIQFSEYQSNHEMSKHFLQYKHMSLRASKSTRFGDTFIRMIIIRFLKSSFFKRAELAKLDLVGSTFKSKQI